MLSKIYSISILLLLIAPATSLSCHSYSEYSNVHKVVENQVLCATYYDIEGETFAFGGVRKNKNITTCSTVEYDVFGTGDFMPIHTCYCNKDLCNDPTNLTELKQIIASVSAF